jgi:hypothetical protein
MMQRTLAFDIECFTDYFLIAFRNVTTGKVATYEQYEGHPLDVAKLRRIIQTFKLVSFNGNHYDLPVLGMALTGADCARIREVSDAIILGGKKYWEVARQFQFAIPEANHIDLMEVAPGMGGLKLYGGRLHCRTLQDLPIEPDASILPEQRETLKAYCTNDLDLTVALFNKLLPQIQLRERMSAQYGMDLRSKSDAQIAEAVIKVGVQDLSGKQVVRPEVRPWTRFQYQTPDFIQFHTRPLQDALALVQDAEFRIDGAGTLLMPEVLSNATIPIGESVYRLGIGGLHSSEARIAHVSDADHVLLDRDVASYYPSIILRCGFAPQHLGADFLKVYRGIVERRLEAKRNGDKVTANAMKVTCNGTYGKLGSKWSVLYSPELLIQVTLTGQLALLMLIELLETHAIPVVSANTDGIVIKCPRAKSDELSLIIEHWEQVSGFVTEETQYLALYARDVNNYIAIKPDGQTKTKGAYADAGLAKNPASGICTAAVIAWLVDGVPLEQTITGCQDITRFVTVRTVKGGAVKDGEYLGKVVRWYYAAGAVGTINYQSNGYTVPKSAGAKPLMTLPDTLPDDIDYAWYIDEARGILTDIGAVVPDLAVVHAPVLASPQATLFEETAA